MPGDELLGVEAFRLAELEEVIERGLSSFVEVGEALIEVQERRLYRRFGTFENYCSERWGLKRTRAYELMDASRVSEISDTPIEREGHAKQLRPLKDDPPALKAAAGCLMVVLVGLPLLVAFYGMLILVAVLAVADSVRDIRDARAMARELDDCVGVEDEDWLGYVDWSLPEAQR